MRFLISVFCCLCLLSCIKNTVSDQDLEGDWELINVECFCFFDEETDFTKTKITFNVKENTVTVTQEGDNDFFKKEGTYNYSGDKNRIDFTDGTSYNFEIIQSSVLILSNIDDPQIADDEVSYIFDHR